MDLNRLKSPLRSFLLRRSSAIKRSHRYVSPISSQCTDHSGVVSCSGD
ncbi:unnamed protein product [Brassica rapa]|uniref:Uncharacterized protein n=2 Tax=Brassica TaxID=3705 RepID=A0A8D9G3R4_BRACM|nr:unnamed protein product [Brassica napus]CAG7868215.1 unnamed protein product [Brassica rapa]CAG7893276.1 unnamed protein product [Brassica rapa]